MNCAQTEAAHPTLTHLQNTLFYDSQMNYDATCTALLPADSLMYPTQKENLVSCSTVILLIHHGL